MPRRLILLIGLVACGRIQPTDNDMEILDPIVNPSPSTFVDKLPPVSGTSKGGKGSGGGAASKFDFEYHDFSMTGVSRVGLTEPANTNNIANFEVSVAQGRVRLYFADPKKGYRYIEATPGQPARITGAMLRPPPGPAYYVLLEAVGSEASGVACHIWRKG